MLTREELVEKYKKLVNVSDFKKADDNAVKFLGKDVRLRLSHTKNKKYDVYNPSTDKWIPFGDIRYQDYTYHKDPVRRQAYLKRATKIKGDWVLDKYSPNALAINILW
jgi:hypothetical protein